jgi:hypothetical protein
MFLFLSGLIIDYLSCLFIFLGHDTLFLKFFRIDHDNDFTIITGENYILRICHGDMPSVD